MMAIAPAPRTPNQPRIAGLKAAQRAIANEPPELGRCKLTGTVPKAALPHGSPE